MFPLLELVDEAPVGVNKGAFLEDDIAGDVVGYFHFPDEVGDDEGGCAGDAGAAMDENGLAANDGVVNYFTGDWKDWPDHFEACILYRKGMSLDKR